MIPKIAYACPSYRRPHCPTVDYLPYVSVYIDPSDEEAYRQVMPEANLVICPEGVQGNLPRVRNYILDQEFGNGADIVVMLDDDVKSIVTRRVNEETKFGYEKNLITADMMDGFVCHGSTLCLDADLGMWGVNANSDNMSYMHYQPFNFTKTSCGQFMVFVKDELRFDENLPLKEDFDMCVQQCNRYRGVLVINYAYVEADFGKLGGGTAVRRNTERELEQYLLFRKKWGSKVVRTAKKDSGRGAKARKVVNTYDFSHPVVRVPIKGV